ncbi:GntR family transcriptional regulator [Spirosoma endophyticum]|uniref:Transcriptional regulator, GntR family n=1 Tax=Spirosoma endophyticum TaxID=662367 RepID=A0A1I2GUM7_9BACT|nr:GntR family transcriptional regulator [Spirosoma endophyticum]SFF20840.1 transcriptional regulator, GntR family [Spirosoma endophyticum]
MLGPIAINNLSPLPKYRQIINSIIKGIEYNSIGPGEKLPSIYELCNQLDVSKRTVERAYDQLKEQAIIESVHGKGYYINHSKLGRSQKIFLLFNKLSEHKKMVYDGFVDQLGTDSKGNPIAVDFYIYNNNYETFKNLLLNHLQSYSHYVVVPHFYDNQEKAALLLNQLPKDKLILLDKLVEGVTGNYGSVVQNFEKDLIQALTEALPLLSKYTTLNMLFPKHTYQPKAILKGFYQFCYEYSFKANVIYDVEQLTIQPGHAYINLMEEDLVTVVKKTKATNYQVGKDIGILSYNETPLKEVLLDGITVMSTDFDRMGRTAANLIRTNECRHLENPFRLITRNSL